MMMMIVPCNSGVKMIHFSWFVCVYLGGIN